MCVWRAGIVQCNVKIFWPDDWWVAFTARNVQDHETTPGTELGLWDGKKMGNTREMFKIHMWNRFHAYQILILSVLWVVSKSWTILDHGELWVGRRVSGEERSGCFDTDHWCWPLQCGDTLTQPSFSSHSYPGIARHEPEYHGHSPPYDTTHATTHSHQLSTNIFLEYCFIFFKL